jgi:hypothetical protein
MKYLNEFNTALDNNLFCSFLLAIGLVEVKNNTEIFFDKIQMNYSGIGFVGLSFVLFCLNLYDGIRQISKFKYHLIITMILIVFYVVISMRVVELALDFRGVT